MSGELRIYTEAPEAEGPLTGSKFVAMINGLRMKLRPGSITERELADGAVTEAKLSRPLSDVLQDGAVKTVHLADAALSADAAGQGKMADKYVTEAKLGFTPSGALIDDGAIEERHLAAGAASASNYATAAKTDLYSASGLTSHTWYDLPDMEVTITPGSVSSVILLAAMLNINSASFGYARFTRNGTAVGVPSAAGSRTCSTGPVGVTDRFKYPGSNSWWYEQFAGRNNVILWADEPATVAAVTYKVQVVTLGTIRMNGNPPFASLSAEYGRGISTLTALEI